MTSTSSSTTLLKKESWAHGTIEAAVQDVKMTASAIHMESRDQDLGITLQLAVSALNSTEYTAGFSAYQWAYGRSFNVSDEDYMTYHQVDPRNRLCKFWLRHAREQRMLQDLQEHEGSCPSSVTQRYDSRCVLTIQWIWLKCGAEFGLRLNTKCQGAASRCQPDHTGSVPDVWSSVKSCLIKTR